MFALVTGGGGFLGQYIVDQLLARGDRVRIFSRGAYPQLAARGVECHRGDLTDAAAVRSACRGVEAVFHTAAVPGVWGSWKRYYTANTLGTQHVLDACRAEGIERLIYTSTPSVVYDGRAHEGADESLPYATRFLCHYPHSKMLAEQAVLAANGMNGLATVALRPHLIWGPRDNHLIPRLLDRARSGRLRRVGDGTNKISMTYVENGAAAHLQAADTLHPTAPHAGRAYFINEPEPVALWPWVDQILQLAGLPPVRKRISLSAAYTIGSICEAAWWTLRLRGEPPMTRFIALQLGTSHYYKIDAARRDFGYTPLVSTDEGMARLGRELSNRA